MNPVDFHDFGGATLTVDHQFTSGDHSAPADQFVRRKVALVRVATHALRRLRIDEADLDAEGAVDLAFFQLYRHVDHGFERPIDDDQFLKLMTVIIRRVIRDRLKRAGAYKRTGPIGDQAAGDDKIVDHGTRADRGPHHAPRRRDLHLDTLRSPEPPVDELIAVKLELEAFLERLPDELHRGVFMLRHQGHSIGAIATLMGLSRSTVERKLKNNQRIFRMWKHNP